MLHVAAEDDCARDMTMSGDLSMCVVRELNSRVHFSHLEMNTAHAFSAYYLILFMQESNQNDCRITRRLNASF